MLKKTLAILALTLVAVPAFAAEGGATSEWIPVAARIGLAIAVFGGALGQGKIISAAVESIARNPGAAAEIKGAWFLGLVFVESLVVYALLALFI